MQRYFILVLACLTLGLAPVFPEPHIVGKIRWLMGGGKGMTLMDWWDTLMHGAPWIVLLYTLIHDMFVKFNKHQP